MLKFFRREPDLYVGGKEKPYLKRWHVIPQNRFLNIYLHKFLRDDDDRALHCHPWYSLSIGLGFYEEIIKKKDGNIRVRRFPLFPVFRKAAHAHRIILPRDQRGRPIPTWTIFITGPKVREWGFHCPKGWRHWRDFCDERDGGSVGKGCGD